MTDNAKLAEQQARGERARQILEDPVVKGFFAQAEEETMAAWRHSAVDETELREDAWRMYQALQRLRRCFEATIANGEFARKELLAKRESDEPSRR